MSKEVRDFRAATWVTKRGDWVWDAEPGAIKLTWYVDTGNCGVSGFEPELFGSRCNELSHQLERAANFADTHTRMAQRSENYPGDMGLVRKQLPPAQDALASSGGASQVASAFAEDTDKYVFLPDEEGLTDRGWFAPESNPDLFGTLFIYARDEGASRHRFQHRNVEVTWNVGQVGITGTVLESAVWNDREGVRRCVEMVLADEREAYLAAVAMQRRTDEFQEDAKRQAKRASTLRARDAFSRPRDRIKPRLIEAILCDTVRQMPQDWRDTLEQSRHMIDTTIHSLDSFDVFGYNRYGGSTPKPINAVGQARFQRHNYRYGSRYNQAQTTPAPPPPVEHFDLWAAKVQDKLNERRLGTLLRYTHNQKTTYLVVNNPNLVFAYAASFEIPDGATIEKFTPTGDTRWVQMHTITYPADVA